MAFGAPTRYWQLDPAKALNGADGWDKAITEASTIYNGRIVGTRVLVLFAFKPSNCSNSSNHSLQSDEY